jgi:hypothetical protein
MSSNPCHRATVTQLILFVSNVRGILKHIVDADLIKCVQGYMTI